MAQLLNNLRPPTPTPLYSPSTHSESPRSVLQSVTRHQSVDQDWASRQRKLRCNGKVSCLFSDNRRQEQARKALDNALGGKKSEFEKWNKEIEKREEVSGGGDTGGGGWFGWGRRFGWYNGDHFWQEAQQTSLAVLGIIVMYLIVTKGEVMLAVVFNPLLFALRGTRNGFTYITSSILRKISPNSHAHFENMSKKEVYSRPSAKDGVLKKWRSE